MRKFLRRTTFIAISGSNGKTTATRILSEVLGSHAPTRSTRYNRNTFYGITEAIAFCNPWKTRFAVFEVAAGQPGAIHRAMTLIRPDVSVMLSVFLEHRSFFRNIEAVAKEKAILLEELQEHGVAVINADDPLVANMPLPPGRKVMRFGASKDYDVYCENVESAWPQLLSFTAVVGGERQEIETRLLGMHWTGPIMACISVAHVLGIPLSRIARAISEVSPYPARMQVVQLPSGATVIRDEFKGSEHTISTAFEEMTKANAKRKFLAFCDVAESSRSPRDRLEKIGKRSAKIFDYVLFIGPKADHGVRGAISAGIGENQAMAFPDYQAAADFLKTDLGPGDVLLLKAQRNSQLVRLFYSLLGEVRCTIPFCDKRTVCDDCPEFRNPELVRYANEQLTVRVN
jgi:UDP-N-acetylmuramoyl-tripeptide--D-alanyl-D-alanine ligase